MNLQDLNATAAAEQRGVILRALYEARYGFVSEGVIAGELQEAGYSPSHQGLSRDLRYLEGKGLVVTQPAPDRSGLRARLTAAGADHIEWTSPDVVGVGREGTGPSVRQRQLREARWQILVVLQLWDPYSATETQVGKAIDQELMLTTPALRCELCYLREAGLATLETDREVWRATITPAGIDVVQYAVAAPAGVTRPPQYF